MPFKHKKELTVLAKNLRKKMTKEECHLWFDFLKEYPQKFLRQKVIGNYIVDFYCPAVKLVVEIDGSQHFEDKEILYDNKRTEFLRQFGITVLRFTNKDIWLRFSDVCQRIDDYINKE